MFNNKYYGSEMIHVLVGYLCSYVFNWSKDICFEYLHCLRLTFYFYSQCVSVCRGILREYTLDEETIFSIKKVLNCRIVCLVLFKLRYVLLSELNEHLSLIVVIWMRLDPQKLRWLNGLVFWMKACNRVSMQVCHNNDFSV